MTDTTVSVIVPAYNHARYIRHTIESIAAQSTVPYELIIIDDKSTDETFACASEAARDLPFKKVLVQHTENRGLCATLNEGLSIAQGKYVMFLASDDTVPPEKLERQTAFLERHPEFAAIYADMVILSEDGKALRVDRSITREQNVSASAEVHEMSFEAVLLGRSSAFIQSGLFRRTALLSVGAFDEALRLEDLDVTLRLLRAGRLAYEFQPGANYRTHAQGTNRNFRRLEPDYDTILEKHRTYALDAGMSERQLRAANALRRAVNRSNADERLGAIAWSLRALLNEPLRRQPYVLIARAAAPRFARDVLRSLRRRSQ